MHNMYTYCSNNKTPLICNNIAVGINPFISIFLEEQIHKDIVTKIHRAEDFLPAASRWIEKSFLECLPVLGRHKIVDDGVDCGVQVQEDPRDVHQVLIRNIVHLLRHPREPKDEY